MNVFQYFKSKKVVSSVQFRNKNQTHVKIVCHLFNIYTKLLSLHQSDMKTTL